ncbi:MAG: hypothetical protein ACYTGH_19080, partial [Planctomycetota bacterium]
MRRLCSLVLSVFIIMGMAQGAESKVLYESSFTGGAKGWEKHDQAFVSDIARVKGHKSLLLKQWKDEEKGSYWLSPKIANPGKPIALSFWAADNYLKQTDGSYAPVIEIVSYDKAGKEIASTWYLSFMPWDDERKASLWGLRQPEGLKWKYYQSVSKALKGDHVRLKYYWRKPIVRGECYVTDLAVAEATAEEIAATAFGAKSKAARTDASRYILEISTPVTGNLFYRDDPLRFDVFTHTNDEKPFDTLKAPKLIYEITDFEKFLMARGEIDFKDAESYSYQDKPLKGKRRFNL